MEVLLRIDPLSSEALHRQLYDAVRTAILTGRLRPGDKLPATRVLAEQLSLSRTTVAEAYDQLQAEGYILGKHGSGTYVAPDLPEDASLAVNGRVHVRRSAEQPSFSQWGQKIVSGEYLHLARPEEPGDVEFDFRPHRIDGDRFPWQTWNSAVERALEHAREGLLRYPPSGGYPELLTQIATHIARHRGVNCFPEQIAIVNGTQQGLNLIAELLLQPGDHVAVEDPGYPAARLVFGTRGLQVTYVPVDGEGMEVDRLVHRQDIKLVHVTPSHQEPTGATLSLGRRLALLDWAERSGCVVLEDDYDSEFRYEGRPIESLQGLDSSGLVVYAGTFSKSVLPGLRIGFVVLPDHLVQPFVMAKSLWDSGTSVMEQAALAEFMASGEYERHIRRMRRIYRDKRDLLVTALQRCFGSHVLVGQRHGGLNVLVQFNLPYSEQEIVLRAGAAGVYLQPGSRYFAQRHDPPIFLLGFGGPAANRIEAGVTRLASALVPATQSSPVA